MDSTAERMGSPYRRGKEGTRRPSKDGDEPQLNMRYLIDTHIFIWYAKEQDMLTPDVSAVVFDYENELLVSMETVKELLVLYRTKRIMSRYWATPIAMIDSIQHQYGIRILQPDMEVMRTLAKMEINTAKEHNDPSDHIIIAQAITMKIPLISGDHKFPWYRNQGLELIYNGKE